MTSITNFFDQKQETSHLMPCSGEKCSFLKHQFSDYCGCQMKKLIYEIDVLFQKNNY
jgi:hypothetical protein